MLRGIPVLSRILVASPEQRALLERWERAPNTPQRVALRARIILRSLDSATSKQIGEDLNVSSHLTFSQLTFQTGS